MFKGSSGTWPGIPLTPTQTLGLNPDWYFEWCVTKGNFSKVLLNTWGQLDSLGTASKDFTIPPMPGFNLSLDLHHAFVVFNFSTNAPFYADVSYPVLLRIRP